MASKKAESRKETMQNKFETFDSEINIEHKKIPKIFLTDDRYYHSTQRIKCVCYFAVLISNS